MTVVLVCVAVAALAVLGAAHLFVRWLKGKETASAIPVGVARGVRAQIRELRTIILANQDVLNAYGARIDAAAGTLEAATVANTAAVDALRAEVAAGQVEVALDVTSIEAATVRAEAAAAAAVVPPVEPAPAV